MGIQGSSWVKDLVLHPSSSQEQLADSPLPARYQDVIGPSERNKFIPKKWGGQQPSQSKYWELPIHQAPVQGSLSGTGDLWEEIYATGGLILHCETLLVHSPEKNIRQIQGSPLQQLGLRGTSKSP